MNSSFVAALDNVNQKNNSNSKGRQMRVGRATGVIVITRLWGEDVINQYLK